MKRFIFSFFTVLLVLFTAQMLWAQTASLSLQGVLRDNTGRAVDDGTYSMTFKIYNAETDGTEIWSSGATSVEVENGIYNAILTGFTGVAFDEDYWVEISVAGETFGSRIQLTTAPYALSIMGTDNVFPNSGYVGIGTANPQTSLHVENETSASWVKGIITNVPNLTTNQTGVIQIGKENATNNNVYLGFRYVDDQSSSNLGVLGFGGTGTVMALRADGNVGIGTTSPAAKLDVNGDARVGGDLSVVNDIRLGGTHQIFDSANGVVNWGPNGNFYFRTLSTQGDAGTYTNRMMIGSTGNVGIGTISPGANLEVNFTYTASNIIPGYGLRIRNGDYYWDFATNNYGTDRDLFLYFNGTQRVRIEDTTGEYHSYSDRRLKKTIRPMEPVLDKVLQLKPSTFLFNEQPDSDAPSIGFIAQDVQEIFPDLVNEDEYLSLRYDDFGILAIAAIQEQQAKIDALETQVADLQAQLKELEQLRTEFAQFKDLLEKQHTVKQTSLH